MGKPKHPKTSREPRRAEAPLRALPPAKRVVVFDPRRDGFPWLGLLAGLVGWVVILALLATL